MTDHAANRSSPRHRRTVFTKPWKDVPIEELASLTACLGVDGIELPVRPGYQVEPEHVERDLPRAAETCRARAIEIVSVAAEPTESIVRACGEAGVGTLRTMIRIDMEQGYRACVEEAQEAYRRLTPLLKRSGVRIGVQNHEGRFVASAVGLMDLVSCLDPEAVCVVLDFAHCSLDGEPVDMAVDICGDRTGLVNLKSAYRRRTTGAMSEEAAWRIDWTTARDSTYSWRNAVEALTTAGYRGDFCLPAEYSTGDGTGFLEGDDVLPHLTYDLAYLDRLLGEPTGER